MSFNLLDVGVTLGHAPTLFCDAVYDQICPALFVIIDFLELN